jgi:hypothetical protein
LEDGSVVQLIHLGFAVGDSGMIVRPAQILERVKRAFHVALFLFLTLVSTCTRNGVSAAR